jgi:hypothetical protein
MKVEKGKKYILVMPKTYRNGIRTEECIEQDEKFVSDMEKHLGIKIIEVCWGNANQPLQFIEYEGDEVVLK